MTAAVCLLAALLVTALLSFISYIQMLYLESLRILKRESESLDFFREHLNHEIGLDNDDGSLAFSLLKHMLLPVMGLLFLCTLFRPSVPQWQYLLEAVGFSFGAMLLSTYLIPILLYSRTKGLWMRKVLPLIKLLSWTAMPLMALVHGFRSLLQSERHARGEDDPTDTAENIEALITAGAEEGIIEEEDRKLIQSVVAFGDKSVREVMTPRPDIVAIGIAQSLEDLRQLVIHEQYSRIPVFENSIDNLVGFVHVRDIFELDAEERLEKPLKELIRDLPLVPETKPVTDLLREMQRDGSHIVGVIDEYGNTAGLATMEDLVEEILGEIRDEHEPERDVRQESETAFIAPGGLHLDRLQDLIAFRPEEETESTTIGGLISEWLGRVPKVGEVARRDGIRIEVLAANERRVDEVRVSREEAPLTVVAAE